MEDSSPDLSLKLRRRSSDSRDSFYMDFAQGIDSDIEEVISGAAAPPLGDGDDVTLPPPPDVIGPEDLLPVDEETQRYVTWVPRGRAVGAVTNGVKQASCGGVCTLSYFTEAVTVSFVLSHSWLSQNFRKRLLTSS